MKSCSLIVSLGVLTLFLDFSTQEASDYGECVDGKWKMTAVSHPGCNYMSNNMDTDWVCGSDGKTYFCELWFYMTNGDAVCTDPPVHIVNQGYCTVNCEDTGSCRVDKQLGYCEPDAALINPDGSRLAQLLCRKTCNFCQEDLKNGGEDCWEGCNHIQGKCDWCGVGNFCCRQGRDGNGCDGNVGGEHKHICVVSGTDPQIFSKDGDVALTKGDLVWTTSDWSDEFKVEYDVIVNKELPGSYKSLLHLTTGPDWSRIPAIFLQPDKYFNIVYPVNGIYNYVQKYNYELNKDYHFEISQQRNSKGEAVYSIKVNGETFHEIINTKPVKFKDVKLYLSDPWYETFAPFGKLSNLKVIADLNTLRRMNPEE